MPAGAAHVITGVALLTTSCTVAVALEWFVVSVGMNVTERVLVPTGGTVPAAGV
jgi:hypothetical protein